ncbi:LCP family protein [Alicyclobacillus mengziensis]|uniref:LCP family protein n=1 Tax=Alicyclobacillus mengziensis TaxID=2931921 RepID=A0A9X7W0M8_9BACL|nr:LCP family protein [Alicyclobacillus mengziensis]QSO47153.1 LCP family protein [Alicyclobacillus mengziensis]
MKKKGIIALISSLVGIVVVGGAVGAALLWAPVGVNKPGAANTSNSTAPVKSNLSIGQRISENLLHINKTMNVLLIANNARNATSPLSLGTAAGQADIILIAHIDPTTHKITLISVPRDTLIAMPQYDIPIPKIKSAFNIGLNESPDMGPKLEIKAVSQLTGLPISYWIVTDFQGFIDAVNAVGGIQVNVPARLYDPAHSGVNLYPGLQTLNGAQALAYVRVRQNAAGNSYRINDFQRQQAEMQVLDILKNKLLDSATNPLKLYKLIKLWHKDVATNLSTEQLVGIGMAASGSSVNKIILGSDKDSMDMAGTPLPGANKQGYITGAYYDILDPTKIYKTLQPLGSTGSSTGLPSIPQPNQVTVSVYGSPVIYNTLKHAGYLASYAGGTSAGRVNIYYPPGKINLAWAVARTLGTGNAWVAPDSNLSSTVVVYG